MTDYPGSDIVLEKCGHFQIVRFMNVYRMSLLVLTAAVVQCCSDDDRGIKLGSSSIILEQKAFDPAAYAAGWRVTNWQLSEKAEALVGSGILNDGEFWQSPGLDITPLHYFKVEVTTEGEGQPFVGGYGINVAATWGRYPHEAAVGGELVADDWTAWDPDPEGNLVRRIYFSRARVNALKSGVRLMGSGVKFSEVRVSHATNEEVLQWADELYQSEMVPLEWAPSEKADVICPKSAAVLAGGGRLRVVFLGDSIMNDSGNSTVDVLLQRAYPGSEVEVITAVGGGTGAGAWLNDDKTEWPKHDLDLREAVTLTRPNLVLIGGISHGRTWAEVVPALIGKIRTYAAQEQISEPEILLLTGAFGEKTDMPAYAEGLAAIASDTSCGFLDLRAISEAYFIEAANGGMPREHFLRDRLHANHRGKQLMGRIFLRFFGG